MNSHLKFIILFFLGCILVCSCGKDSDTQIESIDNIPDPIEKVYATVYGQVLDEDGASIANAFVKLDDEESQSDENGFFKITGYLNQRGANLFVTKAGYFNGSGLVVPYVDLEVRTEITLVKKEVSEEGDSRNKINYDDSRFKVAFEANSFVTANGAYDGQVLVYGASFMPSDANFNQVYPGDNLTYAQNKYRIIEPYGILDLEMSSSSNEDLDINGSAEVIMKIDNNLLNDAPNTVALWYKDEASGLWIEDGEAMKVGDSYVGQVTHFTKWLFGLSFEVYNISGVVTRNGVSMPNASMGFSYGPYRSKFYAASDGSYSKNFIVSNVYSSTKTIDLADNCDVILKAVVLPNVNSDLIEDFNINQAANSFSVDGQVVCMSTGEVISDAYLLVNFENSNRTDIYTTDGNGNFSFTYDDCNNQDIILRAYNTTTGAISDNISIDSDVSGLLVDICQSVVTSFMRFEIEGEAPYTISGCFVEITDPWSGLFASERYIFTAMDNFEGDSSVSGEFVNYKMEVTVNTGGTGLQGPQGPPYDPAFAGELSANVPFYYSWEPPLGTIISEDNEIVKFETTDQVVIKKWVNGNSTIVEGKIVFEAIIQ